MLIYSLQQLAKRKADELEDFGGKKTLHFKLVIRVTDCQ
jgi:hypothetical protein